MPLHYYLNESEGWTLKIAELEQETRRERQQAGIAVAKQQGKYKGRAKKADPSKAMKLREQGKTVAEIAKALHVTRNTVFVYFRTLRKNQTASVT